jgi:hypothetical protein
MKPSILVDLSNGVKFHSSICLLINDTQSHRFSYQVHNHHINNENQIILVHVKINS